MVTIEIPLDLNVVAEYPIAVVSGTGREDEAKAWVAFLRDGEGQEILLKAGFWVGNCDGDARFFVVGSVVDWGDWGSAWGIFGCSVIGVGVDDGGGRFLGRVIASVGVASVAVEFVDNVVKFGDRGGVWDASCVDIGEDAGEVGGVLETVIQMPMVVPPAVAGVALLLAFGRRGWLIGWGFSEDYAVAFTMWAVVVAEVFVSAPFYVQAAVGAFRRVDERLIVVARTLGARPWKVFWGVGLPLAAHGLIAGAAMSWARALGEFGATLMFAGNLQDETQTLPLAIYTALESDLRAAQALSIVLVVVAFALLLFVRAVTRKATGGV